MGRVDRTIFMSKSQVEIVENAERLASNLQAGPQVTKNALLSVVATFMSDPAGDLKRLRRTLDLLEKGSGGHLKRGGGYGEQVHLVIQEVGRLLKREEWQPNELKSLFGWTARLLQVRQAPRNESGEDRQTRRPGHQDSRPGRSPQTPRVPRPPASIREEKKPSDKPFRAISGKNEEALKALREKLSGPKGEDS
jgi:hypothetical protein